MAHSHMLAALAHVCFHFPLCCVLQSPLGAWSTPGLTDLGLASPSAEEQFNPHQGPDSSLLPRTLLSYVHCLLTQSAAPLRAWPSNQNAFFAFLRSFLTIHGSEPVFHGLHRSLIPCCPLTNGPRGTSIRAHLFSCLVGSFSYSKRRGESLQPLLHYPSLPSNRRRVPLLKTGEDEGTQSFG